MPMVLSEIKLHTPKNIKETLHLLAEFNDACILAGGTDLLVDLKEGLRETRHLVSIQNVNELRGIEKREGRIRMGPLVTPHEIINSSLIKQNIPALTDAARFMASQSIRSMATIGGNIASAVPSADLPPSLIAAEAAIEIQCLESSREVPLSGFFQGPRETLCKARELITSILIPLSPPKTGIAFRKFASREASALAVVSVASRLTLKDEKIEKAAIVLGAVAPTPVKASRASQYLCGQKPTERMFEDAAAMAKEEGKPISDVRGSLWYRKELIHVLTCRTLTEALKRSQGESSEGLCS